MVTPGCAVMVNGPDKQWW